MSNQAVTKDTKVKVEVKQEPGIDEFKRYDLGGENKMEETGTAEGEHLRMVKYSVCYTWGV